MPKKCANPRHVPSPHSFRACVRECEIPVCWGFYSILRGKRPGTAISLT
jgi:hypothetical protein